jgi:hypothetical protein
VRLRAVAWRAHHPRWAFDPASGQGAALHGGGSIASAFPASTHRCAFQPRGAQAGIHLDLGCNHHLLSYCALLDYADE